MPDGPTMTERDGQRATTRITLEVEAGHDGPAQVLGDHLAAEVDALLNRWGADSGCVVVHVEAIAEGDSLSPRLPAIAYEEGR
jgi:hypothetical protein